MTIKNLKLPYKTLNKTQYKADYKTVDKQDKRFCLQTL